MENNNEKLHMMKCNGIETALLDLLSRKSFDEISISEICKTAEVSRTAFYKNYKSKQDILNEIIKKKNFNTALKMNVARNLDSNIMWETMLNEIKKEKELLKIVFSINDGVFINNVDSDMNELIKIMTMDVKEYEMVFYVGAITSVIIAWVNDDCKTSVDYIARLFTEKIC